MIEKYGSGIQRIRFAFNDYGLPAPVFENYQHGFRVVTTANGATDPETDPKTDLKTDLKTDPKNVVDNVVDNVTDNVVDNETAIIALLNQNNQLSAAKLAGKLAITERTAQRYLQARSVKAG